MLLTEADDSKGNKEESGFEFNATASDCVDVLGERTGAVTAFRPFVRSHLRLPSL